MAFENASLAEKRVARKRTPRPSTLPRRRRSGTDGRRAKRVAEDELRELNADAGAVRELGLQREGDAASGVVGRQVKGLDEDVALEAVHAGEDDLLHDRDAVDLDAERRDEELLSVDLRVVS